MLAQLKCNNGKLADQLRRSLSAIPALLAEASELRDGNGAQLMRRAYGETREAKHHLRTALVWRQIDPSAELVQGARALDAVCRILHRLTRRST